jgi:hypothetical protein
MNSAVLGAGEVFIYFSGAGKFAEAGEIFIYTQIMGKCSAA